MGTVTKKTLMFTVYLAREAHQLAEQFSQEQAEFEKAEQIYLNSLAVYAVNFYLQCLGFKTDFSANKSRDLTRHNWLNVADLVVKDKGKLECRYVLPGSDFIEVPQEALSDRIGYVAVEINNSMKEATLLGFTKQVTNQLFPLSQLRRLDDLPAYLNQINNSYSKEKK
jgi:hypothetical protein